MIRAQVQFEPVPGPRSRVINRNLIALGLALTTATVAVGQEALPTDQGFEMERATWTGTLADGDAVTVINPFGDVRARFGGYEGKVEVLAILQQFAGEGPRLALDGKITETGAEVRVGARDAQSGEWITARDPGQKKRADLVVFVPLGAPLRISTDHGLVEVKGVKSDVRASTASGEMVVRGIAGDLDLESGSGEVLVTLETREAGRQQRIVSGSGDVTVYLSEDSNLTLGAATSGLLSTDFSMDVDYDAERLPVRRGEAVIGKGTHHVTIRSDSGHLRLVRRPVARKARPKGDS